MNSHVRFDPACCLLWRRCACIYIFALQSRRCVKKKTNYARKKIMQEISILKHSRNKWGKTPRPACFSSKCREKGFNIVCCMYGCLCVFLFVFFFCLCVFLLTKNSLHANMQTQREREREWQKHTNTNSNAQSRARVRSLSLSLSLSPLSLSQANRYVEDTLKMQEVLEGSMSRLPSAQFERVLHPIFEEDELTLIIVGGILGGLAGFGQTFFY